MGGLGHLISSWTVLNSGVPASPSSSKRAASTLVSVAPACSRRCSAVSRSASERDAVASRGDLHVDVARKQVEDRLRDADVGFDAADERLVASAQVEAVRAGGGEDRLRQPRRVAEVIGDLGNGVAEPARVLLGDEHRHAEGLGAPDENRRAGRDVCECGDRLAEGLLHVDHDEHSAAAVEQACGHGASLPGSGAAATANARSR